MASLPSDENPELAPGQQPINRGNINREIIDGELVDYGDSSDEEEPAAQVAAEGRQRQNAGDILAPASRQEAQRPAWARDFGIPHWARTFGQDENVGDTSVQASGQEAQRPAWARDASCKKCRRQLLVILNAY